jgi:signal transduction histidine kinase
MQIRSRLTLQFTVLVSTILLVSFVAIYYFSYINTNQDFYDRLRYKAISTAELLLKVRQVDNELLTIFERSNRDLIFNENVFIFDERNRLIYRNKDTSAIRVSNYWLDEIRKSGQIRYSDGDFRVVGLYYKYPFNKAVVIVAAQDLYGKANLSNLLTILIGSFLIATLVVALVGWFFSKRALQPISRVMNEVEGILPNRLNQRLEVPNQQDEIGRLTMTFNNLLNRIEEAFRLQKTFVANVSHELKNPLTKIQAQLEVSLLKKRMPHEYEQTLFSVLEDVRDLSSLSISLLELAKVSEEHSEILTERIRLDELVWDAREALLEAKPEYTILFELADLPEDDSMLELYGNPTLLKTAFTNLMDNACKFSEKLQVLIRLEIHNNGLTLHFTDQGKGISPEEQALIFQPFYRSDKTANIKGYGIGLSLVDRIIKLHKGTISLVSHPSAGTTISCFFQSLSTL